MFAALVITAALAAPHGGPAPAGQGTGAPTQPQVPAPAAPGTQPPATQPPATQPPATQPPATQPPGTQPAPGSQQPVPPGTQPPAAPGTPEAPAAPAGPARAFTARTGLMFNTVRPERVADFEKVMAYLYAALEKSTDPQMRAQAAGWRVYRATEPGPNGTVLYVYVIDPAIPKADYGLGPILANAYPDQIQEIWKLYTGSTTGGGSLLNLTPLEPAPVPTLAPGAGPAGVTAPTGATTPAPKPPAPRPPAARPPAPPPGS